MYGTCNLVKDSLQQGKVLLMPQGVVKCQFMLDHHLNVAQCYKPLKFSSNNSNVLQETLIQIVCNTRCVLTTENENHYGIILLSFECAHVRATKDI